MLGVPNPTAWQIMRKPKGGKGGKRGAKGKTRVLCICMYGLDMLKAEVKISLHFKVKRSESGSEEK